MFNMSFAQGFAQFEANTMAMRQCAAAYTMLLRRLNDAGPHSRAISLTREEVDQLLRALSRDDSK